MYESCVTLSKWHFCHNATLNLVALGFAGVAKYMYSWYIAEKMSLWDPRFRERLVALLTRMQTESQGLYDIDRTCSCVKGYMYVFACYWWSTWKNPRFWSLIIPASGLLVGVPSWLLSVCFTLLTNQYCLWELSSFFLTYGAIKASDPLANSLTPDDDFASFVHGCVWKRRRVWERKRYQVK